jgi:hypothetical protein
MRNQAVFEVLLHQRRNVMRVAVKAMLMALAVPAGASTLAGCGLTAEVLETGIHCPVTGTVEAVLVVLEITADLTGHGFDFFNEYLGSSHHEVTLWSVTPEQAALMGPGTVMEIMLVHSVSGHIPPDFNGDHTGLVTDTWQLIRLQLPPS